MSTKRGIAILGSTGSIGTQALDVIRSQSDFFTVEVLTSFNNADLLIKQALEFIPNAVVIGDENKYQYVKEALGKSPIKVFAGKENGCRKSFLSSGNNPAFLNISRLPVFEPHRDRSEGHPYRGKPSFRDNCSSSGVTLNAEIWAT